MAAAQKGVRTIVIRPSLIYGRGLGVNAGHDLNLGNLPLFLLSVPKVLEVSIGHALISDALDCGLAEAVRRYLEAIRQGNASPEKRTS